MIKKTLLAIFLFSISLFCFAAEETNRDAASKLVWAEVDDKGIAQVNLYFFWSEKCPHCLAARPVILTLAQELEWLTLHSLELSKHPENVDLYQSVAEKLGLERISVPAFLFCGNVVFGFDSALTTGQYLRKNLEKCQTQAQEKVLSKMEMTNPAPDAPIRIPVIGELQADKFSLPVFTVIIAIMDAFNPCAFFVLLFLLSLLSHTHNRKRMLLIGGVFVFISGFVYFLCLFRKIYGSIPALEVSPSYEITLFQAFRTV